MSKIDTVYRVIDEKISAIETQGKRASVIVMSDLLYKQLQQEMMYLDLSQSSGVIRSPFSLQVYKNVKVVTSQTVPLVEVF